MRALTTGEYGELKPEGIAAFAEEYAAHFAGGAPEDKWLYVLGKDRAPRPRRHRRAEIPSPLSASPRGLNREQAAAYVGVSAWLFDEMVALDGRMPKPKKINTRPVWDRHELDNAFAALPNEETAQRKVRFST